MLALTSTQGFWIVDEHANSAWRIDCGKGVYYGISWSHDRIFVAARQAQYGGERDGQRNVILCFDKRLRLVEQIVPATEIRDVHQILCRDGMLYVTSTYDDCIHILDPGDRTWQVWHPFGGAGDRGQDRHHINSIYVSGEEIWLSGIHPRGWAARFRREDRGEIARQYLGNAPHNTWMQRGRQHVFSSDDGEIRSTDGVALPVAPRAWLRGIAQSEDGHWLGACEPAGRENRHRSDLCLFHLVDGAVRRGLTLRGEGMVHDLRNLALADAATHNGTAFALDPDALDGRFQSVALEEGYGPFAG